MQLFRQFQEARPIIKVEHIYISEGHKFYGRHGKAALDFPMIKKESINCVAGSGIEGDRFFNFKEDYRGQITFFSMEVFEELCDTLLVFDKDVSALRRNVFTRGVDLNELIGKEFEIQGIQFKGTVECSPCYWMNQSFGEGAEDCLKGRGGLRAKILTDGSLTTD